MNGQQLTAPQFGVWSGLPPLTDNPAAVRAAPMPAETRAKLAALRAKCYDTSALRIARHPTVWSRGR